MMRIGARGDISRLDRLEELGFDLIEMSVAALSTKTAAELAEIRQRLADSKTRCVSCNCLLPGSQTPLYLDEGLREARTYLQRMMPVLADLGIQTVVFGSGITRRMPENVPQTRRHQIICDFLTLLEKMAREYGITVLIEPLNRLETNMLNTTEEAVSYIRELNLPNLKLLVDLYHFYREHEPMERIVEYGAYIRHIHIAEPTCRDYLRDSDGYDYKPFFAALEAIGYDGAVVFEGGQGDFQTGIAETYQVLRRFCK